MLSPGRQGRRSDMQDVPDDPIIVQSDPCILLETTGPQFATARDALSRFAESVKRPECIHTDRLSDLSLWNDASARRTVDGVIGDLV